MSRLAAKDDIFVLKVQVKKTLWILYMAILKRINSMQPKDHTGDPVFASDGYHIKPSSAARDAGMDAGVPEDIYGDTRPLLSGTGIGADEAFGVGVYQPMVILVKSP